MAQQLIHPFEVFDVGREMVQKHHKESVEKVVGQKVSNKKQAMA
jgi:hypothetical protein